MVMIRAIIRPEKVDETLKTLADAGYPNGEGFPVVEYLYNTSDAHKAVAEALQFMWEEELGVKVTLNNQEWAAFLQTRKDGDRWRKQRCTVCKR